MNRKSGSVEERMVLGQEVRGSNLGSVAPKQVVVAWSFRKEGERQADRAVNFKS